MVSLPALAQKIGQTASQVGCQLVKFAKDPVEHLRRGYLTVKSEANLFKDLAKLSPKEFKDAVTSLNQIMKNLQFGGCQGVVFHLSHCDGDSLVWQKTVRIVCYKIDFEHRTAHITRTLSIRQFWRIRHGILQQTQLSLVTAEQEEDTSVSQPSGNETGGSTEETKNEERSLTPQAVLNQVEDIAEQEECCICMDNGFEVSLPCAHSFCKQCIENWNVEHNSCPMCRNQFKSKDEFWEIQSAPDNEEFGQYVLRLASGS